MEVTLMNKVSRKWLVVVAWLIVAGAFSLGHTCSASADCAGVGDLMYQVLSNCGEPSWVQSKEERTVGSGFVPFHTPDGWLRGPLIVTEIEQWVYNFGPSRFMWVLTFENGILRSISNGGYGY
jgi:hypothetical protein